MSLYSTAGRGCHDARLLAEARAACSERYRKKIRSRNIPAISGSINQLCQRAGGNIWSVPLVSNISLKYFLTPKHWPRLSSKLEIFSSSVLDSFIWFVRGFSSKALHGSIYLLPNYKILLLVFLLFVSGLQSVQISKSCADRSPYGSQSPHTCQGGEAPRGPLYFSIVVLRG